MAANTNLASISCLQSVEWVSLMRDQEIKTEDRVRLNQHVASCPSCHLASEQFSQLFVGLDRLLARPDKT